MLGVVKWECSGNVYSIGTLDTFIGFLMSGLYSSQDEQKTEIIQTTDQWQREQLSCQLYRTLCTDCKKLFSLHAAAW